MCIDTNFNAYLFKCIKLKQKGNTCISFSNLLIFVTYVYSYFSSNDRRAHEQFIFPSENPIRL